MEHLLSAYGQLCNIFEYLLVSNSKGFPVLSPIDMVFVGFLLAPSVFIIFDATSLLATLFNRFSKKSRVQGWALLGLSISLASALLGFIWNLLSAFQWNRNLVLFPLLIAIYAAAPVRLWFVIAKHNDPRIDWTRIAMAECFILFFSCLFSVPILVYGILCLFFIGC